MFVFLTSIISGPSTVQYGTIKERMDGWNEWFHLARPDIATPVFQSHKMEVDIEMPKCL